MWHERSYRNVCNISFLPFYLAVIFITRLFSTSAFRVPNFNCVFVFALATLNAYIHLCIGNTIGILSDNLLVATYALSCLCIPVYNAVAEWVFSHVSHVTSVFKMWKSCDFECV